MIHKKFCSLSIVTLSTTTWLQLINSYTNNCTSSSCCNLTLRHIMQQQRCRNLIKIYFIQLKFSLVYYSVYYIACTACSSLSDLSFSSVLVNLLLRVCQRVVDPNLWLFLLLLQFVLILIDLSIRQSAKRLTIQFE